MIQRLLVLIFALFLFVPTAEAQLGTVPNTFIAGENIIGALNENFTTAYSLALNRSGGIMTGQLTSQAIVPASTATYDLGSSLVKFRDLFLSRNLDVAGNFNLVGSLSDSDSAVTVADQFQVTSTTFPQVQYRYDGSNYLETSVSSLGAVTINAVGASQSIAFSDPISATGFTVTSTGSQLFARYDSSNYLEVLVSSVGGVTLNAAGTSPLFTSPDAWTFTTSGNAITLASAGPILRWSETDATANNGLWRMYPDVEDFYFQTLNDSGSGEVNIFKVSRTGTTVDSFSIQAAATLISDGTAAAPGLAFINDTNTGVYRSGADTLVIGANGAVVASFSPTGLAATSAIFGTTRATTLIMDATVFAALGSPSSGTILYCSDCTVANPCAAAGTGAIAKRLNGAWVCN